MIKLLLSIILYYICIVNCIEEIEINADSSYLDLLHNSKKGLYSDAYIKDVYHSGIRRAVRDAKTDECRKLIEYEHMENLKTVLNVDQPWLFEDRLFFSQCAETVAKHPPMV